MTFERAEDGTLSRDRCYDEGEFSQAPCLPLNASWGNDAAVAAGGPGWLVRTDTGLMALQRDDDGRLWPADVPGLCDGLRRRGRCGGDARGDLRLR